MHFILLKKKRGRERKKTKQRMIGSAVCVERARPVRLDPCAALSLSGLLCCRFDCLSSPNNKKEEG